jgi:hypothetical protein
VEGYFNKGSNTIAIPYFHRDANSILKVSNKSNELNGKENVSNVRSNLDNPINIYNL